MSFDKLKVVTYSRQINGLPVIGPGSKIVVTIGNNGVVEGVIKRWRPFRTLSAPKAIVAVNTVVDPATALAAFSKRLSQQFPRAIPTIQNMDVALYDSNEKAIQPVYVFETNLLTQRQGPGADSSDQFLGVAPALTSAPEPIYQIGDLSGNPTPPANDIQ